MSLEVVVVCLDDIAQMIIDEAKCTTEEARTPTRVKDCWSKFVRQHNKNYLLRVGGAMWAGVV